LPGVNVVLKGTTTGTVTDTDGNYRLNVPQTGGTLVFTFIGLKSQEVEIGTRTSIDVQMLSDATQLSEVVVTALGDQKNAREIVYANQTVAAKDLLSTPSKNALEALRGKTAGVKITTGSGSVGASTRIILRGEASLTGDNNALIVVDGVPIDNSSAFGGQQAGEGGYADYGNRFNDFNPENIESMTILKGPAATSLYGSRGASGVVVITTKAGQKDNFKVNLSSTSSVERAYILLERQDQFGQGLINPDGTNTWDSGENFSWGPRFDGIVRPWTSPVDADGDGDVEWLSRPWVAAPDQLQNFFRLGKTFNNSLSISGGSDKYTYYLSYGNTDQEGILDNTNYKRHSFTVNATAKLSSKLKTIAKVSFSDVNQNTQQEGSRAFEGQNPYATAIQAPVSIDYRQARDYKNPYHGFTGWYGSYAINPYFILNEYLNNSTSKNFLGTIGLDYTPVENLTVASNLGTNYVTFNSRTGIPQYAYTDHYVWEDNLTLTPRGNRQANTGEYVERLSNSSTVDWTTRVNYNFNVMDRLNISPTVGYNHYDVQRRTLIGETRAGFLSPGIWQLANSVEAPKVTQDHYHKRIQGLFTNLSFGWDEKIFVEYSARNDWSSTLAKGNQSFFYQSVGANAILSDYLDLSENPVINYVKLRTSYGTTGKDAPAYALQSIYVTNPVFVDWGQNYQIVGPFAGQPAATLGAQIGNAALKPEKTTTFEIGTDVSFLKNRIQLQYTFYNSLHRDQIVNVNLPGSSGYTSTYMNVGEIQNTGHEIGLAITPVQLPNGLKWDLNLTWSTNENKVNKVSDQSEELTLYNSGRGVTQVAKKGYSVGTFKGQAPLFTEDGQRIVDEAGNQRYTTDDQVLGNTQPDWLGGLTSTVSYKGFSFGFLIDTRQGGDIFSLTKTAVEFNGTGINTTINDRMPYVIPNSVVENDDGTFSPNTTAIGVDSYVDDGNYGRHIIDGSFVKLREITLGYQLPKSLISSLKMQNASVQLFVKNPKVWMSKENVYADSEVNNPTGTAANVSGIESTQTPNSRSYGINLNITF
jgi:TonB-linked SusC/RagA family outer membrane protein